jgi:hypothetical protein
LFNVTLFEIKAERINSIPSILSTSRSLPTLLSTLTHVFLQDNDRFLMCSKKRPNNKTSNYLISKKENDLARESPNYLGKLRSNFVGTEFQVFDNGQSPDHEEGGHGTHSFSSPVVLWFLWCLFSFRYSP